MNNIKQAHKVCRATWILSNNVDISNSGIISTSSTISIIMNTVN